MLQGFTIHSRCADDALADQAALAERLGRLGLHGRWVGEPAGPALTRCRLDDATAARWTPGFDTLALRSRWDAAAIPPARRLQAEIVASWLVSPVTIPFPSLAEFDSALRMRVHLVDAARRTHMDFHTDRVDRPQAFWHHDEDRGFLLNDGCDLVEALRQATQPAVSGRVHAFSCYRATEYVILLALAQEARRVNPALYQALTRQWRVRAIASGRFHDVFLHEWGSNEQPLPSTWFVPGDRVWFRNPDEPSSDVAGYEGSWVIYLGRGRFVNFWKPERPYTLQDKCLEIFHWRHGVVRDARGELQMDEDEVERRVARSRLDANEVRDIVQRMSRLKDPRGVYADGGCMDTTRESPRWIRPGTSDLVLPDAAAA